MRNTGRARCRGTIDVRPPCRCAIGACFAVPAAEDVVVPRSGDAVRIRDARGLSLTEVITELSRLRQGVRLGHRELTGCTPIRARRPRGHSNAGYDRAAEVPERIVGVVFR